MTDHEKCHKEFEWGQLSGNLQEIQHDLKEIKETLKCHTIKLNRRPIIDKLWSGASGLTGGFTAMLIYLKFWK